MKNTSLFLVSVIAWSVDQVWSISTVVIIIIDGRHQVSLDVVIYSHPWDYAMLLNGNSLFLRMVKDTHVKYFCIHTFQFQPTNIINAWTRKHIHTCMHLCIQTHAHTHKRTQTRTWTHKPTQTHAHAYTHAHADTHTYIHAHTQTQTERIWS